MKLDQKTVLSELRDYLILIALGVGLGAINVWAIDEFQSSDFIQIASINCVMWIALWKGNEYLTEYISSKISWIRFPAKRFFIGLAATITYTVGAIYLIILISGDIRIDFLETYLTGGIVTLMIAMFMHVKEFLTSWKNAALEADRYQRETVLSKYETLKNQVNPHFLFNNLNALTNLIYEDKNKASLFIKKLGEVYHYVLDSKDKEVVPIADDLQFLRSYLFLQQIRFGDKLKIEFDLSNTEFFVAPLALQMLIENAIKHNIVSEDDPLIINIYLDGNFIVVKNNLQLKSSIGRSGTGIGLENIAKRYESLGARVEIIEDRQFFVVKIPLLGTAAASRII